ncbi:hypothetical protein [Micromonospora sp. NPDC049240]|uniref:hypothetical protein n=1 Tax=Micromonospora sp. NPDC049240 TaxID=3155151 RepID=UPI0033FCE842
MPYRAFTVKHELVTHLQGLGPDVELVPGVIRLRDGQRGEATEMDIEELVSQ